jgi:hypothetical protein
MESIPKGLEHLLEKRATASRRKIKDRRVSGNAEKPKVDRRVAKRRKTQVRRKP